MEDISDTVHGGRGARPGTLYLVATPIGNLRDITLRALDILASAELVAAEDTRTTSGLLSAHHVRARLVPYHEHNERRAAQSLLESLKAGKSVALVSDAGTPGISDPGAALVDLARSHDIPVVPIPGPSAVTTLLSVSGVMGRQWLFHGFLPPRPAARRKVLESLANMTYPILFYESPHRILECVADMNALLGGDRQLLIGREMTKLFETVHVLPLAEASAWLEADSHRQRGEFALLLEGKPDTPDDPLSAARTLLGALLEELPASQAARVAARITGQRKNALYDLALAMAATAGTMDETK